jgi:four helix bundle protein
VRRKHHDLLAWQRAISLVKLIYVETSRFPSHETFGLASQMRRAAVSVPGNIAEGAARGSNREFMRFLGIARGSLSELETYLVIARDLNYLNDVEKTEQLIDDVFRLLGGLLNAQKRKEAA